MSRNRLILSGVVAVMVVLGLGYAWGAAGRFAVRNALDECRLQSDIAAARGAILQARVELYNMNFGDAAGHFEDAKAPLNRARDRYQRVGNNGAAGSIYAASAHVGESQRLAGRLDPAANARAADALEAIRVAAEQ